MVDTRSGFQRLFQLSGRKAWEAPWYRRVLRIGDARRCELGDLAQIGSADFNVLEFDAEAGVIAIRGNIPVTVTIAVGGLDVSVEETDEVLGLARYTTWRGVSYTGNVQPLM